MKTSISITLILLCAVVFVASEVPFVKMPPNEACPAGRGITSAARCQEASNYFSTFGLHPKRSLQIGSWVGVPFQCSAQVKYDDAFHFSSNVYTDNARFVTGEFVMICERGDHVLDKNTFIITNHKYYHANLAQWGSGSRDMGTYEQHVVTDQLWVLNQDTRNPGYYYITNAKYGTRIGKWGSGDQQVGAYGGQYHDDQMWRFVRKGKNEYVIYNKVYSSAKMAKWGKGDGDWGTYAGAENDDQHWILTPRYEANLADDEVMHFCNRGSTPITREVSYTEGITLSSTASITTTVGLETSLTVGIEELGLGASQTLKTEISSSLSSTETHNWSKTVKTTYTVPAGKEYHVTQQVVNFNSAKIPNDNLVLHSSILRVEEKPATHDC